MKFLSSAVEQGASRGWAYVCTGTQESIDHQVSLKMADSEFNPKADDEARKVMARARKHIAESGIDCAAPIHRQDAARFMVEFAVLGCTRWTGVGIDLLIVDTQTLPIGVGLACPNLSCLNQIRSVFACSPRVDGCFFR